MSRTARSLSAALFALVTGVTHAMETLEPGLHKLLLESEAIRYALLVPPGYNGATPVPMVVALHYGGPVSPHYGASLLEVLIGPGLAATGALMVAPDNVGGGWDNAASEQRVLTLLEHLRHAHNIDGDRLLVTGYSLGGIGAWYLAARHPTVFSAAIPISGRPPTALSLSELETPVYVIHSRQDEVFDLAGTERVVRSLRSRGIEVRLDVRDGPTHYEVGAFVDALEAAVPWLEAVWRRR